MFPRFSLCTYFVKLHCSEKNKEIKSDFTSVFVSGHFLKNLCHKFHDKDTSDLWNRCNL